jgi:hypothetical protein
MPLVKLEGNEGFVTNLGRKFHPGEPGQLPRLLSGCRAGGSGHQQLVGNCLPAVLCHLRGYPGEQAWSSASQMSTELRLER